MPVLLDDLIPLLSLGVALFYRPSPLLSIHQPAHVLPHIWPHQECRRSCRILRRVGGSSQSRQVGGLPLRSSVIERRIVSQSWFAHAQCNPLYGHTDLLV